MAPRGHPLRARPPSQSHHAAEKGEEANGGHREPVSGARDFLQGWAPLELGPENNEEHFETFSMKVDLGGLEREKVCNQQRCRRRVHEDINSATSSSDRASPQD